MRGQRQPPRHLALPVRCNRLGGFLVALVLASLGGMLVLWQHVPVNLAPDRYDTISLLAVETLRLRTEGRAASVGAPAKQTVDGSATSAEPTPIAGGGLETGAVASVITGEVSSSEEPPRPATTMARSPPPSSPPAAPPVSSTSSRAPRAPASHPRGIPRIIHQSWKSTERIPARFAPWMRSWAQRHPSWTYVFWTDDDNLALFRHLYPRYLRVAERVDKIALADMARYALLHHLGGLYADLDFECLRPMDELHATHELFLSSEPLAHAVLLERSSTAALCNALMASVPGHPFWLRVLEAIKVKFEREGRRAGVVSLTGPRIVKATYERDGERDDGVTVLPAEYFYPEIAYWNEPTMRDACRRRASGDAAARRACAWLDAFPHGEFTNRTHATHHWQCTWCQGERSATYVTLAEVFSPVTPTSMPSTRSPPFRRPRFHPANGTIELH